MTVSFEGIKVGDRVRLFNSETQDEATLTVTDRGDFNDVWISPPTLRRDPGTHRDRAPEVGGRAPGGDPMTIRRADALALRLLILAALILALFWGKPGAMFLAAMLAAVAVARQAVKAS